MDQVSVNFLGFSGSSLAIYFDLLLSNGFKGEINIFKNDDRDATEKFDMGLHYKILMIDDLPGDLNGEFLICSNNPHTKYFLLQVFGPCIHNLENRMMTLIHPNAYIGGGVDIGQGTVIEPGVIVSPYAQLGKGVFIGRGATVGHHVELGQWSTVNPGATLAGKVKVGEYATIGPGSTVINGISIGSKSIIGAGSVVTRDIPPGVIAYGNPCKVIRTNDKWTE